jgi:hypothetical protein
VLFRLFTFSLVLLVTACAGAPRSAPVLSGALPEGVVLPTVWVDVRLRQMGFVRLAPKRLFFARISGLNGSPCVPREASFDPALDLAPGSLARASGSPLGLVGAIDGEGGFAGGADTTCLYDENGLPIWEPTLYEASHVVGNRAYLSNAPVGRYTVAAAMFPGGQNGQSLVVYFPQEMVEGSEQPVPPGASRFLGRYEVTTSAFQKFDPFQARYQAELKPPDPNRVLVAAKWIAAILTEQPVNGGTLHRAGALARAEWPQPTQAEGSD